MMDIQIDYVVPMVFPTDLLWRADLSERQGSKFSMNQGNAVRYRSWGTEELLCRCVRKFMPWVRDIIVILARGSQYQPWMKDIEGLRVVFHNEFMPPECLPNFNSRAIEMFLHCIPGLSDYFIYGNDDMYPLSPLKAEDFFALAQDGKTVLPCQHHNVKRFPAKPNNFHIACFGGLNFVASEFGKEFTTTWLHGGHSIAPILKSSCLHLWQRDPVRMMNSVTPFRNVVNFNQYIFSWYQNLSGMFIDHTPPNKYLSVKRPVSEIIEAMMSPDCGIVCVNDNECCEDFKPYALAVREMMNHKLLNS